MIVYRVEHKEDCWGPYSSDYVKNEHFEVESHHYLIDLPVSCDEKNFFQDERKKLSEELCKAHNEDRNRPVQYTQTNFGRSGFQNLQYLIWWFQHFLDELHKLDYIIRVFDISEEYIRLDKNQLIFSVRLAKLIRTLNINKYVTN